MMLNKIIAVVLAGGRKGFSLREFYHQIEDLITYREWYFRIGYKALKRIKLRGDSAAKPKPMVEYILNILKNTECVDEIIVVGPEKEMREKIDPKLLSEGKKIRLIQQKGDYGDNVKEGYNQAGEKFVLFVTADSPTTSEEDISEFVKICRDIEDGYDVIYPIVKESVLRKYYKLFPRPYFKMIPDNIFPTDYFVPSDFREDGRVGFRITSLGLANLKGFPISRITESYDLRKLNRKSSRVKLKEIFGKNLIKRYMKGLKMSDIEKMVYDYEGLKVKLVGLKAPGSALDIDSTRDEKKITGYEIGMK